MNNPLVFVVIVNWNRWDDTAMCISSVLAMEYDNLSVLVVDNHSETGDETIVKNRWPGIQVIHCPINLGFAGGANMGIRHALTQSADFIFTLNNDAIVDKDCLTELVKAAQEDCTVGIVGPKIYYLGAVTRIWFAGANRHPWLLSLLDFGKGKPDGVVFDQPRQVNYLCAGAMLVRHQVFETVGLFDPGYFMYYEDCDFCMRVNAQGYHLRYVPSAKVWHQVAASSGGEDTPMEVYYRTRSVFRFLWQHSCGLHKVALLTLRILYVIGKMIQRRLAGQGPIARALWRGLWDGLTNMATL